MTSVKATCLDPPTTFTVPSSAPTTIDYALGSGPYTVTLDAYDLGDCAGTYTETLTVDSKDWLSVSGRTITISSTLGSLDSTTDTFTVTSTLAGLTTPTTNSDLVVTVSFSDPCKTAVLQTPTDIASISVADGGQQTEDFTDAGDSEG